MFLRYRLRRDLKKTEQEAERLYAKLEELRSLAETIDPVWDRSTWNALNTSITVALKDWADARARAAIVRAQLNATEGRK